MSGFGGAVKLTGESEYKKALQTIKQNLKEVSSEMKLVTSAFGKNDTSVKALTVRQEGLNKKLALQRTQLSTLKEQYNAMSSQYATNKTKHESLVKSYEDEKKELERIGNELGTNSKEYADQKAKVDALAVEVEKSTKAQDENEKSMSKLRTEMNNAEASVVKTTKEIKGLDAQLKEAKSAEEKAKTATEQLSSTITKQESDLDKLKSAYKDAVLQYGKNSTEAKKLSSEISELSGKLAENKKRMSDADKSADDFDRSLKNVDEASGKADGGFTTLKGTLANLASAGIQKCVEGMKNLASASFEAWQDYDEGSDIIIEKTGATGKSAEGLESVYKRVSKNVVGSYDEIGSAVGEVNTRFGTTGKTLEKTSEYFLKFAKLNDVDVSDAIDKTQSAMRAWGVEGKDTNKMLDLLNKAGQDTGISVDSLADSLMKNTPALKSMGFSVSDATMFLANLEKNGVDASSTMSGLKKALANASKEGKPMSEAMTEMEKSIKGAKNSTEATQKATELFGAKAGPAIAEAVRSGKLSFKDLGTSLDDFEGNVDKTFENTLDAPDRFALAIQGIRTEMAETTGDLMEKYSPQIEKGLEAVSKGVEGLFKIVDKVMGFITNHSKLVVGALTVMGSALGAYLAYRTAIGIMAKAWMAVQKVQMLVSKAQLLMNAIMSANPIGIVVLAIMGLVTAFVILWKKSEAFRNFWKAVWDVIKNVAITVMNVVVKVFSDAWTAIKTVWSVVVGFFTGIWSKIKAVFSGVVGFFRDKFHSAVNAVKNVWNGITDFFKGIWKGIKKAFHNVKDYFSDAFGDAYDAVKGKFDGLPKFFSKLWSKVKNTFSGLGSKIGSAIGGAVKSGINGVIGMIERTINKAIGLINGAIKLINKIPKVNIGTIGKLSLPRLARGGVLEKGQVGLLEGSGAEAVVPLENNAKWIRKVAQDMKSQLTAMNTQSEQRINYDDAVDAFKEALEDMKIILDDDKVGKFVEKTITNLVYA